MFTGIKLYAWEWDKVNNDVLWSEDNPKRQLIVQAARARLWQMVNELREIVDSMEINNMDYTARMVIEEYKGRLAKNTLFSFMGECIKELKDGGRERTSGTYHNADKIVVLKKGSVAEQGTHEGLIAQKGYYYELVKNQKELG